MNATLKEEVSLTTKMGTLLSLVHCILRLTRFTNARFIRNQAGSSRRSVRTISLSSKLVSSPSPFSVLTFTLSDDKFFANL